MHPTLLRSPLGTGFDAATVFAALYGGRDDVFWLDSGPAGMSYLGAGTPVEVDDATVWEMLRAVPQGVVAADDAPAFRLGAVGWLGYELRGGTTGVAVSRPSRYPDAAFLRVDRAIAIDAATGAAELLVRDDDDAAAVGRWREEVLALQGTAPPAPGRSSQAPPTVHWHDSDARYLANVAACQRAIHDGEAYQLCLTTEAEVEGAFDPLGVYLALRASSVTHHGALIRIGGVSLLSASPERFLDIDPSGVVTTRPIKGTRPRGSAAAADAALAAELRASEKERAENLMIVDLMRNDLARVCELGSVAVTELLEVESYPHVHQLVSTVRGQLAAGRRPIDAIEACFPAGSMTGAPKIRATQLLDELEGRARGLYAGAFGYVGLDGRVDLAMSIRSIVLDPRGATVGTGGGITALSVPEEELAEAKLKAAALLAALGVSGPGTAAAGRRLGTVDA
ncbi:anthranilate synthase component I family protein [Lysinimonas soli]|uniref:Anthranilate synthase component I family protein n=1 Tax=Lysinimonas soli TaxID=1074233 RepID=A0ABW0NNM4_9MICO